MTEPPSPDARTQDELALVRAARAGDRVALESLLAREAPRVMRFALRLCPHATDAEDVLQETLLAAARGIGALEHEAALTSWLYTIARSHCVKRARRRRDAPRALEPLEAAEGEAAPSTDAPDESLGNRRLGRALEEAIAGLEPIARDVILLRDVEGLSAPETADVLGIGLEAVKSRLHRARAQLRVSLEPIVSPAEPTVPSDPACPDIVDVLSRHLEGEIGKDACAAMEQHIETCTSCSHACASLRSTLALCHASHDAPLDAAARERVRRVLHRVVQRVIQR
ncbi:MAG: RNA polymerase sigma factor [Sandaracinus sp.]